MNDNNSNNNTYRATRNLNTALEAPEYKADDTLDVNIKDVDNNNYVRDEIINSDKVNNNIKKASNEEIIKKSVDDSSEYNLSSDNENTFISVDIAKGGNVSDYDTSTIDNDDSVALMTGNDEQKSTYTPTSSERKKKEPFSVPNELKLLILIIIVLLVFVFFMPKVYSIFKKIELFFFNR